MSMNDKLEKLAALRLASEQGGGERRVAAQHERGKLTARERLDLLLDARPTKGSDGSTT